MTDSSIDPAKAAAALETLRRADAAGPRAKVVGLTQMEGGWSRWSHLAQIASTDGTTRRYVVRVKAPHGLFDTDLVAEYNVYKGLEELDLPTPRVFGLHTEPDNPFGGQLFVMEFLDGHSANVWRAGDHTWLQADWEGPRGIASDVVAYAAGIHAIGADHAPEGLPTIAFADQVRRWQREYEESGFNRDPVLEESFHWMLANEPSPVPTALVHGDYRIGNMLVKDARVSAILDWELATLGDPLVDFAYHSMIWRLPPELWSGLAGLDLAVHVFRRGRSPLKTWSPGSSPGEYLILQSKLITL